MVQGGLPLVSLYLTKRVVDSVTAGFAAADKQTAFAETAVFIALLAVVTLAGFVFAALTSLVNEVKALHISDHIENILHSKSVAMDLEYYETPQYYDTMHRAQQEAPYRPARIVDGLVRLAQSSMTLLAMVALLFSFHWGVAVVLFAAAVPGVLVKLRYAGQMFRWQRERTPAERLANYFQWLITSSSAAKEMRVFDLGNIFVNRFRSQRQTIRKERLAMSLRRSLAELLAQLAGALAIFGAYAFIAYRTVRGAITMGDLVMYYQAFQRGQGYLKEMLHSLAGLYEDGLFLSNFYEFLELKPKIVEPLVPVAMPQPMRTGIVFERVSFQYPNADDKVLEEVSLTIRPGQVAAFVGENGSGKTTIVKLLARLYDPTEGAITADGIDVRQFASKELRSQISVIFQDYMHYHLAARENIWFGDATLEPTDGRIAAAATISGADEVIGKLPQGYETPLGKWFQNGVELSTGQWQKIALARAFMRDAQIVVLDEPTSSLDAQAEYEVFQKFREIIRGRMAILISHRFSNLRLADVIYVLEHGKILESGSHEELMQKGGKYAHLFELQARSYR